MDNAMRLKWFLLTIFCQAAVSSTLALAHNNFHQHFVASLGYTCLYTRNNELKQLDAPLACPWPAGYAFVAVTSSAASMISSVVSVAFVTSSIVFVAFAASYTLIWRKTWLFVNKQNSLGGGNPFHWVDGGPAVRPSTCWWSATEVL